jgi:DNA-binding response OmpR family regulator
MKQMDCPMRAPRILVVEDQYLLGLDLVEQLKDAGFEPLGPVPSVERALNMLQQTDCDAAILDVNLRNENSAPIARALEGQRKPFIVVSGYTTEQLPPGFESATVLLKPVRPAALVAALRVCLDASSAV